MPADAAGPPACQQQALLVRLRAGDAAAYEELVREHAGRLRSVARRMLRNEADADDAVQETFLSAFKSISTFEGKARFGTWLHRIVVNAALMKLRARGRLEERCIDDLLPKFFDNGAFVGDVREWPETPDDALCRDDLMRTVRECIDELPDAYRIALLLRDIEQLDNSEVAEHLELTPNAAKVRVHRARQALRGLIEGRAVPS